ncbi:hypothetical protein BLAT2472_80041 [Burkholderia latens]
MFNCAVKFTLHCFTARRGPTGGPSLRFYEHLSPSHDADATHKNRNFLRIIELALVIIADAHISNFKRIQIEANDYKSKLK